MVSNISLIESPDRSYPLPFVMLCTYVSLVIWRPWESISYLSGIPVERSFAVLMILVCLSSGKFVIVSSPLNKYVYGLLILHFLLIPFSFNGDATWYESIEYLKVIIVYLLILSVIEGKDNLRVFVQVLVLATLLYSIHSLWEFNNGKYVWRMGIKRMVGASDTYGGPNAFGGTLVLGMPFAYALLRTEISSSFRKLYYLYYAVAVVCIVLTGSRSAMIAFVFLIGLWVFSQSGWKKILYFLFAILMLVTTWHLMPAEKQERIQTLWDEDAGPANAHASTDGRRLGWLASWEMFKKSPLTGVGPGGGNFAEYRETYLDGIYEQAHNLLGQVLAGLGIGGFFLFLGLIVSLWRTTSKAKKLIVLMEREKLSSNFLLSLSQSIFACLLLLLLLGLAGHNFYRPHWLWLAGLSGLLLQYVTSSQKQYEG